jgi:hypothetical protein
MFKNKNNNTLQFNVILNNEVIVLENFNQIFNMASTYFSKSLAIPKKLINT